MRHLTRSRRSLLALAALLASSVASAAVDATVTTALSDAATDGKTVAAAAFLIFLGIGIFKYFRRGV